MQQKYTSKCGKVYSDRLAVCEQIARLGVKYLAISNNENLPHHSIIFCQSELQLVFQILN